MTASRRRNTPRSPRKKIRIVLWGLIPLALLLASPVVVLALPGLFFFPHSERFGEFTVFSSQPLPDRFDLVVEELRARIARMEHARPGAAVNVFLCRDPRRYALFATLTRRDADTMALGLSWFGNVFVNESKVHRVAETNHRGIRHCRFEGNLAASVAHEVAHFNVVNELGLQRARRIPFWKSEGYAEVQANLAAIEGDPSYDLRGRVETLLEDSLWTDAIPRARMLYEWHVLVEFLIVVEGYTLENILDEGTTQEAARSELLAWYSAS